MVINRASFGGVLYVNACEAACFPPQNTFSEKKKKLFTRSEILDWEATLVLKVLPLKHLKFKMYTLQSNGPQTESNWSKFGILTVTAYALV